VPLIFCVSQLSCRLPQVTLRKATVAP